MPPTRPNPALARASSLSDVAAWSDSVAVFRRNLRDWIAHVRALPTKGNAVAGVVAPPRPLRGKFPEGAVADAWLAAYAEYVCLQVGAPIPEWALKPNRFLPAASFDDGVTEARQRALALDQSPEAFRRRNIFTTTAELPLSRPA